MTAEPQRRRTARGGAVEKASERPTAGQPGPKRPDLTIAAPASDSGAQTFTLDPEPRTVATLSPNARAQSHWPRTVARERIMEAVAFRAAVTGLRPMHGPVTVTFRWVVPDRRKRDIDNLAGNGTVKATLDALVRGGYLVDDSTRYVADVRTVVEYVKGQRRLEVTLQAIAQPDRPGAGGDGEGS